ncbi:MAG: hypothetical protein HEP71_24210 [Roseivirga sp.]|nr:hypothetical protein [Roseivirga sp.]
MDTPTILEQYQLFVEMADRVSERRLKTNQFYIGIISGLLGVLAFSFGNSNLDILADSQNSIILTIAILGLVLNVIWFINIRSFRKLNSGKFMVIHEMEALLPFQPYDREWDIIKRGEKKNNYFQLSRIEQYLPIVLSVPFIVLLTLVWL